MVTHRQIAYRDRIEVLLSTYGRAIAVRQLEGLFTVSRCTARRGFVDLMALTIVRTVWPREEQVAAASVEVDGVVHRWCADGDGAMPKDVAIVNERIRTSRSLWVYVVNHG